MAKLRLGNANKGGGGPKATDPWTKTTKNATNRQIGSNQGKAIFGGNFRISQKRRKNLVDFGGNTTQIRVNLEL